MNGRMRSYGPKMEYGKFQVNVSKKKKKIHLNSDQMLEQVTRELVVESPVLEILKTWLYKSLSNLIQIVPPLSSRLDVNSGVSFQPM